MKKKSVIQGVLLWDDLSKPKFYLRYVDDILAAFDKEQDS